MSGINYTAAKAGKSGQKSKKSRKDPNPLCIDARFTFASYEVEVHHWGGANPWGANAKLPSIDDVASGFTVATDGRGNVTRMPRLIGRPCFGRVEVFMRHGAPARPEKVVRKTRIVKEQTRCTRCQVRSSCKGLVTERIKAMPEIESAIVVWHTQCEWLSGGIRTYTGPIGRLWTHVLKCIVRAGQFSNTNDLFVAKHVATSNDRLKEKWRDDKRRQRQRNLVDGQRDDATLKTAPGEADRRLRLLLNYCRGEATPHDLKLWDEATCRSV